MNADNAKYLRKSLLIEHNGTPEEQKEKLVDHILDHFCSPEKWPMYDSERIKLLKEVFAMAQTIRETQSAIQKCEP